MATDKKISQLPAASQVLGADLGVLVHAGANLKFDFDLLVALVTASISVGAKFTFGTVVPQNTDGDNGDVFFKTNSVAFYQKAGGVWAVAYTFNPAGDGTMLYGTSVPSSGTGKNGDSYIDTLTGIFYQKASGAWTQVFSMATGPQGPQGTAGANGTNGTNGNTVLHGTSNPSNFIGVNGDFYINSATIAIFGPKAAGVWGTGFTLVGPIGPGVPDGGTTAQALKKIDNTDQNTEWGDIEFSELAGDPTDNTALNTALGTKVDKVVGKQLSDENYTSAEKSKLAALSEHYKGYFASLSALQAAFPTGVAGDYATVDAGIGVDAQTYIWDVNDTAWILSSGSGAVSSVNSQVGAVVLDTDDIGEGSTNKYYHTSLFNTDLATKTTADLTEGSNLYFTTARVLATLLAGISFGSAAAVTAADSILVAIGKLQAQITGLFFAGGPLTGYSSTSGGNLSSSDTILTGLEKLEWNLNHIVVALNPTAVKTANYNAAVNDFVPVNTTSGAIVITLPTTPADQSQIGIKHIIQGGTNIVTINAGGSDVFNKAGGSTSLTLPLVNQGLLLLYKSGIWYVVSDDLPLSALDTRYTVSPAFTGTPTAPTPSANDNSTKLATTAYVDTATATTQISYNFFQTTL